MMNKSNGIEKRLQLSRRIMAKQTLGGSWLRLSFDDRWSLENFLTKDNDKVQFE